MKKETIIMAMLTVLGFLLITVLPCQANQASWTCPNDDEVNGIYYICNYFPLVPENEWQYTTGEYHIEDKVRTCSSGYSGILFATDTYEYSSFIQNRIDGLLFAGCQYDEGDFEDSGSYFVFVPPQIQLGESTSIETEWGTVDLNIAGFETITVPAGTFNALKIEWTMNSGGGSSCLSYKTTAWFAKRIGPVKFQRTDANPADCLGCMFVCDPDNDVVKLNTPAELISYEINGLNIGPDLTGTWISFTNTCKETKKGIQCKVKGKLNIQNIGTQDAKSSFVRYYLSDDDTYGEGDILLKQVATGKIKTSKSKTKTFSYSFKNDTAGKYIIAVIDADNTVEESDETNNIVYGPLQ